MIDSSFQTFGKYEVIEPPINTGLSTIYKAILPPNQTKYFAIKTISDDSPFKFPNPILEKEIAILKKLQNSPYIVRYVDEGWEGVKRYLVMDYVEGSHPFKGYSKGYKIQFDVELIKTFAMQIADALQHIHDNDICHCDVRPDNIFIVQNKRAILFDFGLAVEMKQQRYRYDEGDERRNLDGQLNKTYFSPEHITDLAEGIDPTGDQYSLALVVIFGLRGTLPPSVNDPDEKIRLRAIDGLFNPGVADVLKKALMEKANERYRTVKEFANRLVKALDADTANSQPDPVLAATGTTDVVNTALNATSSTPKLDEAAHSSSTQKTSRPKSAMRTFGRRSVIAMAASGALALPLTWYKLWPRLLQSLPRPTALHFGDPIGAYLGHRDTVNALAWSPDSQWIASASTDSTLQVWKPRSENIRTTYHCLEGHVTDVAWSNYPGNKLIAFCSKNAVYLWNFSNGTNPYKIYTAPSTITSLAWSPTLNPTLSLAIAGERSLVRVLQLNSNDLSQLQASPSYSTLNSIKPNTILSDVAWSFDGNILAASSKSTSPYVWVWNFNSGDEQIPVMPNLRSGVLSIAWSPEVVDTLAVGLEGEDPFVQVWSNIFEDGNQPVNYHFAGFTRGVDQVTWSPYIPALTKKTYIAAGSERDGIICVWNTDKKFAPKPYSGHRLSTIVSQPFSNNSIDIKALAWSPDGTMIASGGTDSTVLVWASGFGTI